MSEKEYQLTSEKLEELKKELENLQTKGRKDISDKLNWMRLQPPDEEDSGFSEILDDKSYLEKRIAELKRIISNAEVVEKEPESNVVIVGSSVKVAFEGFEEIYHIVDSLEADPINKKISEISPVGEALLGAAVGDTVVVDTGIIKKKFRILAVN